MTGCAPVTVQQTPLKNTYTDVRADVVTTGELSQMTEQVLRMQGVQVAAQEPLQAFQGLDTRSARQPDDDQQVALAEMALLHAMHNASSNPTTANALLFAAEMNFEGLANRHRRFGLGLGLVGFRQNTLAQPADRFFPEVTTAPAAGRPPQLMRIDQLCGVYGVCYGTARD